MRQRHSRGFTLIELLVVITIIGILIGLLLPAVNRVRETGRRTQCISQLRQIGLAVVNYETQFNRYPAAGYFAPSTSSSDGYTIANFRSGTMFSWMVSILPMIDQQPLSDRFDRTKKATEQVGDPQAIQPEVFLCPSDAAEDLVYEYEGKRFAKGNYAAWTSPYHTDYMNHYPGALISHRFHGHASIRDGHSSTFLMSEVRTRDHKQDERGAWALGWNGASLLAYDAHPPNDSVVTGTPPAGVFFYDGVKSKNFMQPPNHTTGLNTDTLFDCPDQSAAQLLKMPCSKYAGYWSAPPRSQHTGGVNVCYMDGHTAFLVDDVDQTLMAFLVSVDDNQPVSLP
jgi:prepilin-type N-terminal cleavage/methylation domain-containing protein/prepilin-type processing-associated H-X9-DG protein